MIFWGLLFLFAWICFGIEWRRREKQNDIDYHLFFGRDIRKKKK